MGGFGNSPLIDTSNIPHQFHGGFALAEELRCSEMGIVNYFWVDLFLSWEKNSKAYNVTLEYIKQVSSQSYFINFFSINMLYYCIYLLRIA